MMRGGSYFHFVVTAFNYFDKYTLSVSHKSLYIVEYEPPNISPTMHSVLLLYNFNAIVCLSIGIFPLAWETFQCH